MPRIGPARRAERRAEILAAAEACFARLGFHQTSMRDVIAEAGLSAGCVYTHFESKHDIIAAIATDRHLAEAELLAQADALGDPIMALRKLGREFIARFATPAGITARRVSVQTWAEALLDDGVRTKVREGVEQPVARIAAIVAHAQRNGRMTADAEPRSLARAMVALFHGFVLQRLWDPTLDAASCLAAWDAILDGLALPKAKRRPQA